MEANLVAFVDRAGLAIRYGCRWTGDPPRDGPDGDGFALETTDGDVPLPDPGRRGGRRRAVHAARHRAWS